MKLDIRLYDTLDRADVIERRWWRPDVRYTVALYAGSDWIRDDTNNYPDERVTLALEAARYAALNPLGIPP
jgi:hypothetical protein